MTIVKRKEDIGAREKRRASAAEWDGLRRMRHCSNGTGQAYTPRTREISLFSLLSLAEAN